MLWDGSGKIFALKVSNKLWSHCSWISHLGSSTAFPAWYGFFRNCWLAFFIFQRLFLLDSLRRSNQIRYWSIASLSHCKSIDSCQNSWSNFNMAILFDLQTVKSTWKIHWEIKILKAGFGAVTFFDISRTLQHFSKIILVNKKKIFSLEDIAQLPITVVKINVYFWSSFRTTSHLFCLNH